MSALTPVYTVGDQIAEAIRVHNRDVSKADARRRAVELLDLVGIAQPERRARAYPHELSGGERQRVVIAIAIANDPDLIICDEPTTALDVTVQAQILEVLRTARDVTGAGVLIITHDLGVVAEFADRALVVVNPEVSSVRDSDRILGLLQSKTKKAEAGERIQEHLLLTRYNPERVEKGEMLSIGDVEEILGLKVIGVIPESPDVLQASNSGNPVILDEQSNAGIAYTDAIARLLGEERPMRFTTAEKKGFFAKIFGG
jgi:ABC-type glutathione transport system ATPase component